MGNLLFSPSGRIGPSAYMKGIIIIATVGLVLSLLPLLSPMLGMVGIIGLVTFYIFIALGIKRSHDAGKSGWMVLVHILLSIIIGVAVAFIVGMITGVSLGEVFSSAFSGDVEAAEAAAAAFEAPGYLIPSAIGSFIGTLITGYVINMMNKQDPGDNQFGPVPSA